MGEHPVLLSYDALMDSSPRFEGTFETSGIDNSVKQVTSQKKGRFCDSGDYTRVGTLIVATICLQLIQNRYMFRSFTVLQCSHQHCVRPVASDVEVVGYL